MHRNALRGLTLALPTVLAFSVSAQITTASGFTPAYYVQNVLLGPGVTASGFVFNGDPNQIGTFTCTTCSVNLPGGLIMGSGDISAAVGPNNNGGLTLGGGYFGIGDPDLNMLIAPDPTNDRASLEFDFVASGDSIKFNYVFASEEYLEWVGSGFQDAFGFFLSGPGIAGPYSGGAVNLAKVPGSLMTPITINTINNVVNSAYYVDNGDGFTPPMSIDPFYIQYDGRTVTLTARAAVQCGQTYHIKLAIADGTDTALDCAVFLEAGSFQSNLVNITSNIISGAIDSVLYEGCGHTTLVFVRGGDLSDSLQVDLVESGTATNGVDHTLVPGTVWFVPGQDSLFIDIEVFLDALAEGFEHVILTANYNNGCANGVSQIELWLNDALPITLTISNDTTLTCGDSTMVAATATGGFGTLYYDWNTGIPDGTLSGWVQPPATTTYVLTVTDDCGVVTETADVTVTIPIPDPLTIAAAPDTTVFCPESPVALTTSVTGGQPGYTYSWTGGLGSAPTANVAPPTTQTWTVTVTDLCGTTAEDEVTVTVQYDTLQVYITPDTVVCAHDSVLLLAHPSLGWNGYTYLWENGEDQDTRLVQPATTTTYTVTLTDGCGISATDNVQIGVNDPIAAFSWNAGIYVEGFPVQFLDESVGANSWYWDFDYPGITSTERFPVVTYPDSGLFNVMLAIVDGLGCVDTTWQSIWINPEVQFYAPNAFTPDGDGTNDVFFGNGVGLDGYHLRIFDRWGEVILDTEQLYGAWDGKVNGTEAPEGVYVYWFRIHSISGKTSEFLGHVTLLR